MVTFTGDLYLGSIDSDIENDVRNHLRNSDFVVSNFENVLKNNGGTVRVDKFSNLQFTKEILKGYLSKVDAKVIFSIGNNHIHDLGQSGIDDTTSFLDKFETVSWTGIGHFVDVIKPIIIEDNNKRIALLCVSTDEPEVMSVLATEEIKGVLDYNDCIIEEVIKHYKKIVDFFVVIPHWGREYVDYPSIPQRKKAYKWIDAGADIIIGHHPHVIQGKEEYMGKWIYYSLGNYIFPDFVNKNGVQHKWSSENNKSVMLQVIFSEVLTIREIGLSYDPNLYKLVVNNSSVSDLVKKSMALDDDIFPVKKYYGIWQKEQFRILKKEYSFRRKLILLFPKHEKHNRFGYFISRLKRKFIK